MVLKSWEMDWSKVEYKPADTKLGDKYEYEDIYNFPLSWGGFGLTDTERYLRDKFNGFPDEYYPLLALRASGMKWATYKKMVRQDRKIEEKIRRRTSKKPHATNILPQKTTISFK